ncbi:MAG: LysR substrate-binding domain-containing protein [Pseudomonadota bacterium]
MDVNRLRALRELARRGTMAAAAEALFLTPSAVSQQVALLEQEVGVALTERRGRGVRLTPAGEALVAHAERIMVVLDEARSEMAQLRREIAGELRVAAFPTIASAVLPETVKALRAVFPRLDVVLEEMEPLDGLAALGSWRTDVALVDDLSAPLAGQPDALGLVPLAQDRLYALLPEAHALASRRSLGMGELRGEAWAMDSTASAFGGVVMGLCRRAGYEPRVNARCTGFEMVAAMVASGCSVSVVPGLRLLRPSPGLRAVRLQPEVRRQISAAYRRGERDHPAVAAFVQELARTTRQLLGPKAA